MRISDWSSDVCSSDLSRKRRQAREEERAKYETTTEDCDRARDDHSFLIRDLLDGADIFIVEHGLGDAWDNVLLVGIAFTPVEGLGGHVCVGTCRTWWAPYLEKPIEEMPLERKE